MSISTADGSGKQDIPNCINTTEFVANDKQLEECRKKKSVCSRCCQCWVIFSVILILIILGLASYVTWKEIFSRDTRLTKKNLDKYFPGYFRSVEEQLLLERRLQYKGLTEVKNVSKVPYYCNSDCQSKPWFNTTRKKRSVTTGGTLYHGCCQSTLRFNSPNNMTNIYNVEKTLFHKATSARQFFKISNCVQAVGCTGCTCMHEEEINTAVVFKVGVDHSEADIDDLEIDIFYIEGCCKCVNDGTS